MEALEKALPACIWNYHWFYQGESTEVEGTKIIWSKMLCRHEDWQYGGQLGTKCGKGSHPAAVRRVHIHG
jgi:hypothetical protein